MQLEVRVYGAHNLRFANPFGIWEASCVVSHEIFTHTVALPKSSVPKMKNSHPVWNKAVHFDLDSPRGKSLNIVVNETSDNGQQSNIGCSDWCQKRSFPLGNGAEIEVGVIFRLPQQQQAFPPSQQQPQFPMVPRATSGFVFPGQVSPGSSPAGFPQPGSPSQHPFFPQAGVLSASGSPAVSSPTTGSPASSSPGAGSRKRTETVGPFQFWEKLGHHSQHGVVNYAPEDLHRVYPHLARGSFGIVFKGWARDVQQQVVIKDMDIQNEGSILEWQKEIDIMAKTKSPYIAEVFGFTRHDNTLTIVMEFMPFGDLFGILHKHPEKHPLSLIQRMRMARHCCLGLQVLHDHNFIHRDIKSMNILVNEEYICKLTDFGCSKLATGNNMLHTANTGTPLWMAPEVKRGQYSFSSDVYSMGLVLYELFERCLPAFDQNTGITSLPKSFQSAPVVLPCVNPNSESRPNVEQLLNILDGLVRKIVSSVKSALSQEEQQLLETAVQAKIQQVAAQGQTQSSIEATLLSLYQYLLRKPASEADALINKALGITPTPPSQQQQQQQQQQQELLMLHAQGQGPPATPQGQVQGQGRGQGQGPPGNHLTGSGREQTMTGRGRGTIAPRGRGSVAPRGRGAGSGTNVRGSAGSVISAGPAQQQSQPQPEEEQKASEQEEWYRPPAPTRDPSETLQNEEGEQLIISFYRA